MTVSRDRHRIGYCPYQNDQEHHGLVSCNQTELNVMMWLMCFPSVLSSVTTTTAALRQGVLEPGFCVEVLNTDAASI
jgi:hypothetical protein